MNLNNINKGSLLEDLEKIAANIRLELFDKEEKKEKQYKDNDDFDEITNVRLFKLEIKPLNINKNKHRKLIKKIFILFFI